MPELNAHIRKIITVNPRLMIIQVEPDGWEIPDYKSGQYCAIGLPPTASRNTLAEAPIKEENLNRLLNRTYSLSSSSRQKDYLEFYITMVPTGSFTPCLFDLKVGDGIWVAPKILGRLTLEGVPDDAYVVLIGTGTGLGPYISMMRSDIMNPKRPGVAILHGVKQAADLGYKDELEALQTANPLFRYEPTISRPQNETEPYAGRTGYVQAIWKDDTLSKAWNTTLTPQNTHIFLCGSPAMVDTMEQELTSSNYQEATPRNPGQIHIERYW